MEAGCLPFINKTFDIKVTNTLVKDLKQLSVNNLTTTKNNNENIKSCIPIK
jgi:hypothetical protein